VYINTNIFVQGRNMKRMPGTRIRSSRCGQWSVIQAWAMVRVCLTTPTTTRLRKSIHTVVAAPNSRYPAYVR
jgi:uncharacterized membrane protein